jgi:hypothetical protein
MEEEEIDVARLYIPDEYLIPGTAADSSADGTTLFDAGQGQRVKTRRKS